VRLIHEDNKPRKDGESGDGHGSTNKEKEKVKLDRTRDEFMVEPHCEGTTEAYRKRYGELTRFGAMDEI
jgi:hypothetical protein